MISLKSYHVSELSILFFSLNDLLISTQFNSVFLWKMKIHVQMPITIKIRDRYSDLYAIFWYFLNIILES